MKQALFIAEGKDTDKKLKSVAKNKKVSGAASETTSAFDRFLENPAVALIFETGKLMSKTTAAKDKAWWAKNKSLYDDAPTLGNPAFNKIYSSSSEFTPDRLLTDQRFIDLGIESVAQLWEEIGKAADSASRVSRAEKQEATSMERAEQQQIAFDEANQPSEDKFEVNLNEFLELSDSFYMDGQKVTIVGKTKDGQVVLDGGERFGRKTYDSNYYIWADADTSDFLAGQDVDEAPAAPSKPTAIEPRTPKKAKQAAAPLAFDQQRLDGRMEQSAETLSESGFPVRPYNKLKYGTPEGRTQVTGGMTEFSNKIARLIQAKFPALTRKQALDQFDAAERKIIEAAPRKTVEGFRKWYDVETGKEVTKKTPIEILYSPISGVIFDNHPVKMAAAMRAGLGPIFIPQNFKGRLNRAFVLDASETKIIDVEAPTASDPSIKKSIVTDGKEPSIPTLTDAGRKALSFMNVVEPPADAKAVFRNVQLLTKSVMLEMRKLAKGKPTSSQEARVAKMVEEAINTQGSILDGEHTYAEAKQRVDQFIRGIQPFVVESRSSADSETVNKYGPLGRALQGYFNLTRSGVSKNSVELETAASNTVAELYVEMMNAVKARFMVTHIFGNQLAANENGEYVVTDRAVQEIESFFSESEVTKAAETPEIIGSSEASALPAETKRQKIAISILRSSKNRKTLVNLIKVPNSSPLEPKEGWENILIQNFIKTAVVDPAVKGNNLQAIDIVPLAQRVRSRNQKAAQRVQAKRRVQGRDRESSYEEVKETQESIEAAAALQSESEELPQSPEIGSRDPLDRVEDVRNFEKVALELVSKAMFTINAYSKKSDAGKRFYAAMEKISSLGRGMPLKNPNRILNDILMDKEPDQFTAGVINEVQGDIPIEVLNVLHLKGYDTKLSAQSEVGAKIERLGIAGRLEAFAITNAQQAPMARAKNNEEIRKYGLVDGDPQSVIRALQKIAKESGNELNQVVAAKILLNNPELIENTEFRIIDQPNADWAGLYAHEGVVTINVARLASGGIETVLLHEYLHAATTQIINKPAAELTPAQRTAIKQLEAIRQQALKSYESVYGEQSGIRDLELEYGLSNLDETIAMLFSSPKFQQLLQRKHQSNYFVRFLRALKRMFRIPESTQLEKAFDALVDLTAEASAYGYSSGIGKVQDIIERGAHNLSRAALPSEVVDVIKPKTFRETYTSSESRMSAFEALDNSREPNEEQQKALDMLITDAVNLVVPPSIPVRVVDEVSDQDGVFAGRENAGVAMAKVNIDGVLQSVLFINRRNFRNALHSHADVISNPIQALHIAEAVLIEEVAHAAEFQTLTTAEVDEVADSMSNAEFDEIIDQYTTDPKLSNELKTRIADGDAETKRQMVGEFLRMRVQKITRGYTTESDIQFYSGNPSLYKMAIRHILRVFRKMYARFKQRSENPMIAYKINKMARELHLITNGRHGPRRLSFDPENPDANFELMDRRFAALLADIDENTSEEEIVERFGNMFDILVYPVGLFERGAYKPSKHAFLTGRLDWRIRELKKFEEMFGRSINAFTQARVNQVQKLRAKFPSITDKTIQDVLGRADAVEVDANLINELEEKFATYSASRRADLQAGVISETEWNDSVSTAAYESMVTIPIDNERTRLKKETMKDRDAALAEIERESPELAKALIELRNTVDALSIKMKATYGVDAELGATISANLGVYITRTYRAFTEDGYVDMMLDSQKRTPEMQAAYDAAYPLFLETYRAEKIKELQKENKDNRRKADDPSKVKILTRKQAEREADEFLERKNFEPVHNAMAAYLHDLTGSYDKYSMEAGATKALLQNLKERKQIPPVIKEFLGMHDESAALTNIVRTIGTLTKMTGRQTFYNHLVELGHDKDNNGEGFLLTHEQLSQKSQDGSLSGEWLNLRTGRRFSQDATVTGRRLLESKEDKTFLYYAPKEMIEDMNAQFKTPILDQDKAGYQKLIDRGADAMRLLTGVSLTAKTLFSVGFYVRNIVGNLGYFQLSQGMINYKYTLKELLPQLKRGVPFTDDAQATDVIRAELLNYGIIGGDITSNLLRQILNKDFKIEDAQRELQENADKIDQIKNWKNKVTETMDAGMRRLLALSDAVDSFYKIGYFAHELDVLRKAQEADPNGNYSNMNEVALKRLAAQKVRETSQSYQDAPEFIRAVSQRFGFVLAPFLRFRTDIIRIAINTVKLARTEIKDDNPVIKSRGIKRLTGFITVYGGIGMLGSVGLRMLLGIGEEEDELYRQTVPDYKKDNTFFFIPNKDGTLTAYDLTFVNPLSPISDPLLRAGEQLMRGNPSRAVSALVTGLWNEYTDTQIFSQAVLDVKQNKDARTGKKIYNDRDGIEKLVPMIGYIWREAFEPRTFKAAQEILKSSQSGPLADPSKSPLALLVNEIKPTRGYRVDPNEMFKRFLRKKRDERNAARSEINIMKSDMVVSDDQIADAMRTYIETSRNIDSEIRRGLVAMGKFNMSLREGVAVMGERSLGMGKRRQANIINGIADRPSLTDEFVRDVIRRVGPEVAIRRFKIAQQVRDEYEPILLLEDSR